MITVPRVLGPRDFLELGPDQSCGRISLNWLLALILASSLNSTSLISRTKLFFEPLFSTDITRRIP